MTDWSEFGLVPPSRRTPLPGPVQDIVGVLAPALERNPEAEALVGRHARFTYRELDRAVNAIAAHLNAIGLKAGDRLFATGGNHPELVIGFLACQRLGVVWVGVNRALAPPEQRALLADCGAALVFGEAAALAPLELRDLPVTTFTPGETGSEFNQALLRHANAAAPEIVIDPWAPAAIAYTSGTTGRPKGAVHSQHNLITLPEAARLMGWRGQWRPELRRGVALPLTILNLMVLGPLTAFVNGAACVCMDRIDVRGVAEWIERERVQTFAAAPTTIYDLLTRADLADLDLSSLILPTSGGSHVPDEIRALYRDRFGVELGFGYGLTEAPAGVCETDVEAPFIRGSCGTPYPHLSLTIRDSADKVLAPDEVGEVCVEPLSDGPWDGVYAPFLGYWLRPEATAQALRGGRLHTGDLGALDEQGRLTIKDRRNDLIIRGGANIYPAEVERVLAEEVGVAACAVVGRPDERLGEVAVAFVQPATGAQADALLARLQARCRENLARYKAPEAWIVVDAMPRNAMGKIVKGDLRKRLTADA